MSDSTLSFCFLSNYLTHHQLPFCLALSRITGNRFSFVETEELPRERKDLGYGELGSRYDFVIRATNTEGVKKAKKAARESDVVLIGSAPDRYVINRLLRGKLTFRVSERIFKNNRMKMLRRAKHIIKNAPYKRKPLYYLLCSAYAPSDYLKCGQKPEKFFKWGYFPETKIYEDLNTVFERKIHASIIWVGRFIGCKHPEIAIDVAEKLRDQGIPFHMTMIGDGPLRGAVENRIKNEHLEEFVKLTGAIPSDQVRAYMEKSEIFIFTSDQNEGWGAVLNEAMNSACAVVANETIGAVPFLCADDESALICKGIEPEEFLKNVKLLLSDDHLRRRLASNAYSTIAGEWNAEHAAARLVSLSRSLLEKKGTPYLEGICSASSVNTVGE